MYTNKWVNMPGYLKIDHNIILLLFFIIWHENVPIFLIDSHKSKKFSTIFHSIKTRFMKNTK